MKIACQSCPAKYTIADDKVVGKIVKIRCKKCNATIVVNGNEMGDAGGVAAQDDLWTVNVADGDQRSMNTSEIISAVRSGSISDESFVWRDGMADWLPVREVEEFASALAPADPGGFPDVGYDEPGEDATVAAPAGVLDAALAAMGTNVASLGNAAPAAAPVAAGAARRAGGRGVGGDLFGAAPEGGVVTSAAPAANYSAPPPPADDKLIGQRNENSVLFSLGSLTGGGSAPKPIQNQTTAEGDASGLIDIRALAATIGTNSPSKPANKVDDIMNLGGGGAFGAALVAPVLAPPPVAATSPLGASPYSVPPEQKSGGNKGLMVAIAGLAVAVLGVGGGGLFYLSNQKPPAPEVAAIPTTGGTAAATTTAAPAPTGDPNGGAIDPTKGSSPPPAVDPTKPVATAKAAGGAATGGSAGGPAAPATATATTAAPATTAAATGKPKSLEEQMRVSTSSGAAAGGSSSGGGAAAGPFDRGAAAASLGGIAASVGSCKKPDGPTGSGHVTVTFAPSGSVKSAIVDSAPFQGSAVGGCIAGKFRGAHVPPFSGGDQAVGKSFSVN